MGEIWNQRKNGDHLDRSVVEFGGYNSQKNQGNLRRLAVTHTLKEGDVTVSGTIPIELLYTPSFAYFFFLT